MILTVVALAPWFAAASAAEPIPDEDCLLCHGDPDLTKTDTDGNKISLFVDEAIFAASAHGTNTCFACHHDLTEEHPDDGVAPQPVSCAGCHEDASRTYNASVHGLAKAAGDLTAPTCVDCHGVHNILPPTDVDSPLHWSHLAAKCGECHSEVAAEVEASVHGVAVRRGVREAPTCTDCHSEHQIEALKGVSSIKLTTQICARCHASERLSTKFHIPSRRTASFFESYHGLAVQRGDTRAANCASCHGHHRILPSSDPDSSINPAHLVETCGQCHPSASANFTIGRVHLSNDDDGLGSLVNRWVRQIYLVLIFVVVGLMVLHNGLTWLHHALEKLRSPARKVPRMGRSERVQHGLLLASFILLALTGFALKFPDSWLAVMFGSDEIIRRWLHRLAGVVLLGTGCYHVIYVLASHRGRQLLRDITPTKQDLADAGTNVRYLLNRAPAPPRIGRFGYIEKAEYWAVIWGTIIMGVTGLVVWFQVPVTRWLPRWAVEVATTVHYYEAILACLSIVVWHFYHVIFAPGVYPINWAWWDGKVTREWQQQEHPLDVPASSSSGQAEVEPSREEREE